MKKCVLTAVGAVLGLALPLAVVHAFWSRANYPIHQNMTKASLGKAGLYAFNGATPGFSTPAIDAITTQNHDQDNSNNYDASDHFDSETLSVSFDELNTTRMQLRSLLTGPTFDQPTIWKLMGRMLHQVQDFYSHSTWDKTQSKIINFGALTSLSPPVSAAVPTTAPLSTEFCAPDQKTLIYTGSALTTGYYPPRAPPAGKCTHGDLSFVAKVGSGVACGLALSSATAAPDGISRDHPCFSNSAANDDYKKAYDLAESETESFVKSITDELVLANNGAGFCALLGVDPSESICGTGLHILPASPSVAVGGTITLVVSATDINGNPVPIHPNVVWTSSDPTIVVIVPEAVTGVAAGSVVVAGYAAGSATITATDPVSTASASTTVVVTLPPPGGVTSAPGCTPDSCFQWNIDSVAFAVDPCPLTLNNPWASCAITLEAASWDGNGPISFIQLFGDATSMMGPIVQWSQTLKIGNQSTSPTVTITLDGTVANGPTATGRDGYNAGIVGFVTKQLVPFPPVSAPDNAIEDSASYLWNQKYLFNNPNPQPGSLTEAVEAVPNANASTCTQLCQVADYYLTGSFDFYVDDAEADDTLGKHHVTGTFRFPLGDQGCQVELNQPYLSCAVPVF